MPTVIPFHRAIIDDPAFAAADAEGFTVYTKWIEEEWTNDLPAFSGEHVEPDAEPDLPPQKYVVEIDGRRIEVALPGSLTIGGGGEAPKKKAKKRRGGSSKSAVSGDAVTAPMQGTVIKVAVEEGQEVSEGDVIVVLEAMKMENPVKAHKSGTVTGLNISEGGQIGKGDVMLELK